MLPELAREGGVGGGGEGGGAGGTGNDSDALLAHERCVPWQAQSIAMPYLGALEAWRQLYRRLTRAEHREVAAYVARTGRALLGELSRWPNEPLVRLHAVRRLGMLVQGAVESHGLHRIVAPIVLPGATPLEDTTRETRAKRDPASFPHPRNLRRIIQRIR